MRHSLELGHHVLRFYNVAGVYSDLQLGRAILKLCALEILNPRYQTPEPWNSLKCDRDDPKVPYVSFDTFCQLSLYSDRDSCPFAIDRLEAIMDAELRGLIRIPPYDQSLFRGIQVLVVVGLSRAVALMDGQIDPRLCPGGSYRVPCGPWSILLQRNVVARPISALQALISMDQFLVRGSDLLSIGAIWEVLVGAVFHTKYASGHLGSKFETESRSHKTLFSTIQLAIDLLLSFSEGKTSFEQEFEEVSRFIECRFKKHMEGFVKEDITLDPVYWTHLSALGVIRDVAGQTCQGVYPISYSVLRQDADFYKKRARETKIAQSLMHYHLGSRISFAEGDYSNGTIYRLGRVRRRRVASYGIKWTCCKPYRTQTTKVQT